MPSLNASEALRQYRRSIVARQIDYDAYFRAWDEIARNMDEGFYGGSQWKNDDRPLTLTEANISEAKVEDGYELYKGKLRRKT